MWFRYISPSSLPSRAANAVHVALQCDGLVKSGADLTLYSKRTLPSEQEFPTALTNAYGVDATRWRLVSYYSQRTKADNLRIAVMALNHIRQDSARASILSRNLYASFVLGVLHRQPLLFETHQLETGFRKTMQRMVMTRPWVRTVVISEKLRECLSQHHGVAPSDSLVLHDAAPEGILPIDWNERRKVLYAIEPSATGDWDAICGYFGHLYPGRGIEVIEAMARARPRSLFLAYGGNEQDVQTRRNANSCPNLRFMGHVPHPAACKIMKALDVLLMPYQHSVSIGVAGHDTAQWMSPMKMFEYLATGVPIISSDLPVLREVLSEGVNALLAHPDDSAQWVSALDQLIRDENMAQMIGAQAHQDYLENHSWTRRGQILLDAASAL